MQIGEQQLAFAQALALNRLGFFDLNDHVGLGEHLFGRSGNLGACGGVIQVGEAEPDSSPRHGFHQYLLPMMGHRLAHARGRHTDAVLMHLDLLGDADEH